MIPLRWDTWENMKFPGYGTGEGLWRELSVGGRTCGQLDLK